MFATGRPPSAMEAPIGIPPIFGIRLTCLTEDVMLWNCYIICLLVTKYVNISEIICQALQSTSQRLCTVAKKNHHKDKLNGETFVDGKRG